MRPRWILDASTGHELSNRAPKCTCRATGTFAFGRWEKELGFIETLNMYPYTEVGGTLFDSLIRFIIGSCMSTSNYSSWLSHILIVKDWKTGSWYATLIISIKSLHWTHWTQIMLLLECLDVRCWTQRSWASEVGRRASVDRLGNSIHGNRNNISVTTKLPEMSRHLLVDIG